MFVNFPSEATISQNSFVTQVSLRDAGHVEGFSDVAVAINVESRLCVDTVPNAEKRPEEGQGAKRSENPG